MTFLLKAFGTSDEMYAWSRLVDYKSYFTWELKNTVNWVLFYLPIQMLYECNLVEFFSVASITALFSMSAVVLIYEVQKTWKEWKNALPLEKKVS